MRIQNQSILSTLLIGTLLASMFFACSSEREAYVPFTVQEDSSFVYSNYNKVETYIPMRDGTKLFTAIYTPIDSSEIYPFIMYRTPYACKPYGDDKYKINLGPNMQMTRDKYIFVYQDVRGQFMSEGKFNNMTPHKTNNFGVQINESTDTFDTIEWLLANVKNNNGKVGQWGISYPGFYTAAGMIDSHPALAAVSPQAPIADWFFDDFHHHGAFFLPHTFNFIPRFDSTKNTSGKKWGSKTNFPTDDGYDFYLDYLTPLYNASNYIGDSIQFWNEIVEHPNYDKFWQDRNLLPHLNNINCAVLTVGGWYDAEDLYGPLNIYKTVEENNPSISNSIIMGPWSHGGWRRTDGDVLGNVHFGAKTSTFFNDQVITPFFSKHLKGSEEEELPEAYMFETGVNEWRKFNEWPPQNAISTKLYFKEQHELSHTPPRENKYGQDMFVSDPSDPVPSSVDAPTSMTKTYMTDDQSFAVRRSDVLHYVTEPLTEDITFAGPIEANLIVKTDQSSADWIVKIIDVYPDDHQPFPHQPDQSMASYHQMIRSEVLRGRFRNGYENPEPFTPKQEERITVSLQDVLHTFKKGHKIMVQVQSTWFPLVDLNPQRYVENIYKAEQDDYVKAKHFVGRSGKNPSYITVSILKKTPLE